MTAAPLISVVADAADADVFGTLLVLVDVIFILPNGMPNSLAAICAIFV